MIGGEITVGSSCSPTTFNSTNNVDYWNGANGCNAADFDDAWGWFIATSTSTTITYASGNDSILHLFTGACNVNMTALACADDGFVGDTETITYATTPGVRYRVRIQRWNNNQNMTGQICVYNTPAPPSNDECTGATTPLTVNTDNTCTTATAGTTVGATQSIPGILCNGLTGAADDDVWFSFEATETNHDITVTPAL